MTYRELSDPASENAQARGGIDHRASEFLFWDPTRREPSFVVQVSPMTRALEYDDAMNQQTKTCELTVRLNSGATLTGMFHVPLELSSTVRPTDAIRQNVSEFFLFSDVTITEESQTRDLETVLIHRNSITYIECSAKAFAICKPNSVMA